jgi:hypothetical protein
MIFVQPTTAAASAGGERFHPTNPGGTIIAAYLTGIANASNQPAQVLDMRTGLGRPEGYASFANARRAAYMLTRGDVRGAAGVYQQGNRFYVRAMGFVAAHTNRATQQLRFEGTNAALAGVSDLRLRALVDGSTRLFPTAS